MAADVGAGQSAAAPAEGEEQPEGMEDLQLLMKRDTAVEVANTQDPVYSVLAEALMQVAVLKAVLGLPAAERKQIAADPSVFWWCLGQLAAIVKLLVAVHNIKLLQQQQHKGKGKRKGKERFTQGQGNQQLVGQVDGSGAQRRAGGCSSGISSSQRDRGPRGPRGGKGTNKELWDLADLPLMELPLLPDQANCVIAGAPFQQLLAMTRFVVGSQHPGLDEEYVRMVWVVVEEYEMRLMSNSALMTDLLIGAKAAADLAARSKRLSSQVGGQMNSSSGSSIESGSSGGSSSSSRSPCSSLSGSRSSPIANDGGRVAFLLTAGAMAFCMNAGVLALGITKAMISRTQRTPNASEAAGVSETRQPCETVKQAGLGHSLQWLRGLLLVINSPYAEVQQLVLGTAPVLLPVLLHLVKEYPERAPLQPLVRTILQRFKGKRPAKQRPKRAALLVKMSAKRLAWPYISAHGCLSIAVYHMAV
jgi:hypothetical protein